jgi:HEAT repeat protein
MRLFLSMRASLPCWLLVASLWTAGGVRADRFPPDPVEELRLALRTTSRDPAAREKLLTRRVEALRSLTDLRRALQLQEWRDEDPDDRIKAIDVPLREAIVRRFEQGVREALKADPTTQKAVARMLAEMGLSIRGTQLKTGLARIFAPDLANLIKQGDPGAREAAARALGQIHADPEVAVPALAGLLRSDLPADRVAATDGLLGMMRTVTGSASRSRSPGGGVEIAPADMVSVGRAIVPVAAAALGDPDVRVRRLAAATLEETTKGLEKLVPETRSEEQLGTQEDTRRQVEEERATLLPLMSALKDHAPALARAMGDADVHIRRSLNRAAEDMGVARVRLLRRAANIAEADGSTEPAPRDKVPAVKLPEDPLLDALRVTRPALTAGVSDPDLRAKLSAIDALETIGQEARPAAPALVRALVDPNRFVRWAAARVVGRIGPVPEVDAVPALTRLLDDTDLDLRRGAAVALGRYGPVARAAVPTLIDALGATDAEMRIAAIRSLEGIGTDSSPAIPSLSRLLADRDARVRQTAAEALGKFGPTADGAVPFLRAALNDENAAVRQAASDALLNILRSSTK